jgi:hypothetical protein
METVHVFIKTVHSPMEATTMGADAFHVFFGVRHLIQSEQELAALEDRTDTRLVAARKARLNTCFGRATDGTSHLLLIGYDLGTFGVENQVESEPRFYFQLEAQY